MSGESSDGQDEFGGRGWAELPATVAAELFGRADLLGGAAVADRSRRVCKGWAAYAINHKSSFFVPIHSVRGQADTTRGWAALPCLKKLEVHGDDAEPDARFPLIDRNIDSFLSVLSRVAPLTSLTVTPGSAVFRDDNDLETLARAQPSLRVLGLFLCRWHKEPPHREVTVKGLVRLLMSLPELEELRLYSESRTKDGPHPALALKALGSSEWLDLPAKRRSRLKKLALSSFLPPPQGLVALEALPNLTDLSICSRNFQQLSLAKLTTLKHLDIRSPGGAAVNPLDTMDLSSMRSLQSLETFSIEISNDLPDDAVKTIASLRSLRKLDIQGLQFMDPNGPTTPEQSPCDVRLLEPLAPTLTALSISEFPWGAYSRGLQVLRPLTNLQSLSISSCIPMLERDLSGLEDLTALTELSLKGISLPREQAESFARLPRLRSLGLSMSINHYQSHEQQGAILESITSLKSLTDLDLSFCEVTLNQLRFLARRNGSLPSLKRLGLCHSKAIQQITEATGSSKSNLPAWMGGGAEALSFSRRFGLIMSWREAEPLLLKSQHYTCEMAEQLPFWSDLIMDVLMDELEAVGMSPADVLKVLAGAEGGDRYMQCILDAAQESLDTELAQLQLKDAMRMTSA